MIHELFAKWRRFNSATKLALVPPAPRPDRHGVAVAAIVKNEARHIAEWAHFHHQAGIRHLIVYDNGSTDETVAVLQATLPREALTVIPWRQSIKDARLGRTLHNQVLAYAHAASNFGEAFRWMAFIDVDEFLVPKQTDCIPAAIAHLDQCRNVSLPWRLFGTSGHKDPPPGGVLRNYLRCSPPPDGTRRGPYNFKCIVDPCHLTSLRVHSMETDRTDWTCNDRGERARNRDRHHLSFYSVDHLQLNHYFTRSESELADKMRRGNISNTSVRYTRKVRHLAERIERKTGEDRAVLDFLDRLGTPHERT